MPWYFGDCDGGSAANRDLDLGLCATYLTVDPAPLKVFAVWTQVLGRHHLLSFAPCQTYSDPITVTVLGASGGKEMRLMDTFFTRHGAHGGRWQMADGRWFPRASDQRS
jgi:hypothetical protein